MFQSSGLAFYGEKDFQSANRHWCSGVNGIHLAFPKYKTIPFWLIHDTAPSISTDVQIVSLKNGNYYLAQQLTSFSTVSDATQNIVYSFCDVCDINPNSNATIEMPNSSGGLTIVTDLYKWLNNEGPFYLQFEVNGNPVFSETFTFQQVFGTSLNTPCGYCVISWTDTKDIGNIIYSKGTLKNEIYVAADVGKPEYLIEQESEKDGNNDTYKTFEKLSKKYELEFLAPESLVDAVSLIPLHSDVEIYNQYGESQLAKEIEIDIKWTTSCLATVKLTYVIDKFIRKNC